MTSFSLSALFFEIAWSDRPTDRQTLACYNKDIFTYDGSCKQMIFKLNCSVDSIVALT